MIVFFSYIIAVVLTLALAIVLYPIAAIFWLFEFSGKVLVFIFGLFGKVSDNMFRFTTKVIHNLWKEIKQMNNPVTVSVSGTQWTCICGATNSGKFCSECGKPMNTKDE